MPKRKREYYTMPVFVKKYRKIRRSSARRTISRAMRKYVRRRRYKRYARRALGFVPKMFPSSFKVRLRQVDEVLLNHQFTQVCMNSLTPYHMIRGVGRTSTGSGYDSVFANQPRGQDQWRKLYQKYCVVASKVILDPIYVQPTENSTTGAKTMPCELIGWKDDGVYTGAPAIPDPGTTGNANFVKNLREAGRPHVVSRLSNDPNEYGVHQKKKQVHTFGVWKDFGLNKKKTQLFRVTKVGQQIQPAWNDIAPEHRVWAINDDNNSTFAASQPGRKQFLHVAVRSYFGTQQQVFCRITYVVDVVFFDMGGIPASTINNTTI